MHSHPSFTCLLAIILVLPATADAMNLYRVDAHEFGSNGYLRAGGGESGGDTQICFKAAGAGAKYRLGNECETYGKASLYYRHQTDKDGPYFHAELMPEFSGPYGDAVEYKRYVQSWIELGNIAGSPIDFWIGRRYSYRRDIHINDYFYMNLWGDGSGVRDIPVGTALLAVTYSQDEENVTLGQARQQTLDFSLYELASNPGGKVMADWRFHRIASGGNKVNGWAASLQHQQSAVLGGTNTAVIQYGRGAARAAWSAPLEGVGALSGLVTPSAADNLAAAETWRLLDFHVFESPRWAMMSSALVEWRDSRDFDGTRQTWASLGVRPMVFLDEHWRLVGELGYDRVSGQPSFGWLLKQTLAVEWAPSRVFFARPALRGYVTHANWSDSYRGVLGTPRYGNATEGWSAGLQLEVWW